MKRVDIENIIYLHHIPRDISLKMFRRELLQAFFQPDMYAIGLGTDEDGFEEKELILRLVLIGLFGLRTHQMTFPRAVTRGDF